ncbi:hypothetical protein LJC36_04790 [Desulfovibrio sp. OttesenSCG-928-C14]|nr:hypothetical protein [Desulfovibrio sp. OttesenSCG-928-C14]
MDFDGTHFIDPYGCKLLADKNSLITLRAAGTDMHDFAGAWNFDEDAGCFVNAAGYKVVAENGSTIGITAGLADTVTLEGAWSFVNGAFVSPDGHKAVMAGPGKVKIETEATDSISLNGEWSWSNGAFTPPSGSYTLEVSGGAKILINSDDPVELDGAWTFADGCFSNAVGVKVAVASGKEVAFDLESAESVTLNGEWGFDGTKFTYSDGSNSYTVDMNGTGTLIISGTDSDTLSFSGDWGYYGGFFTPPGGSYRVQVSGGQLVSINPDSLVELGAGWSFADGVYTHTDGARITVPGGEVAFDLASGQGIALEGAWSFDGTCFSYTDSASVTHQVSMAGEGKLVIDAGAGDLSFSGEWSYIGGALVPPSGDYLVEIADGGTVTLGASSGDSVTIHGNWVFNSTEQAYALVGSGFDFLAVSGADQIEIIGGAGGGTITGGTGNLIVRGADDGNDTLDAGTAGTKEMHGGGGDDILIIHDAVTYNAIDGGEGSDTLRFGDAGLILDMISSPVNITGIESIEMSENSQLWVDLNAAKSMGTDASGVVKLEIFGDTSDTLYLDGLDELDWDVSVQGDHTLYTSTDSTVELWVYNNIVVQNG